MIQSLCVRWISLLLKGYGRDEGISFLARGGIALALVLDLSACTNPYDPGQRAAVVALLAQEPAPRLAVRLAAEPARLSERHPVERLGQSPVTPPPLPQY